MRYECLFCKRTPGDTRLTISECGTYWLCTPGNMTCCTKIALTGKCDHT